jgi:DNA recombination-dependent growth factor C
MSLFPRSILFYTLSSDAVVDMAQCEEAFNQFLFVPCLPENSYSIGFASLMKTAQICHPVGDGAFVFRVHYQEKIIPSDEINRLVAGRMEKIEAEEGRLVRSKEKTELKIQINEELRLTALSRYKSVDVLFMPQRKRVAVLSSTPKFADSVNAFIRKALSSYPIIISEPIKPINLNDVLMGKIHSPAFRLLDVVKLENDASAKANFDGCDLDGARKMLEDGFNVVSVRMGFGEHFSFKLDKTLMPSALSWPQAMVDSFEISGAGSSSASSDEGDAQEEAKQLYRLKASADMHLIHDSIARFDDSLAGITGGFKEHIRKVEDLDDETASLEDKMVNEIANIVEGAL